MSASALEVGHVLSHREVEVAHRYLSATRTAVVRTVGDLSREQATFTPAPGRWSIANVVEHLCALEELFVNRIVPRLLEAPPTTPPDEEGAGDARVIGLERNPSTRIVERGRASLAEAPSPLLPTGRRALDESLQRFLSARQRTIRVLQSSPDLREHVIDHLALGPLDGYQWLLFIAAHTERHLRQIEVLKADPEFPPMPAAAMIA